MPASSRMVGAASTFVPIKLKNVLAATPCERSNRAVALPSLASTSCVDFPAKGDEDVQFVGLRDGCSHGEHAEGGLGCCNLGETCLQPGHGLETMGSCANESK
jgi:hypothetical protein